MDTNVILIICSSVACIISGISLIIGTYSMIKVMAMEKSTHSVQFVPAEMKPEQNWATEDKVFEDINKDIKEEKEEFFGI